MTAARTAYILVAAVALAAALPAVRNGFVYDDVAAVQSDTRIHSLEHPARLLALPYWNDEMRDRIYRPLTTLSFAVDWALGDGKAWPFHVANIALHVGVCLLVFALSRRVLGAGPGALVAALWFAVHPVHVEAFAGVVGRSELLAAFGYLAAMIAYLSESRAAHVNPAGPRRAVLAVVVLLATVIAVGGKEHALTLPAALLLCDAWLARAHREQFGAVFRRHALTWLAVVMIGIGYLVARAAVVGTSFGGGAVGAGLEHLTAPSRFLVMLPALLVWLRLLAWPAHLSADYSPNAFVPVAQVTALHVVALLALLGCVVFAWTMRRRAPGVGVGLALFVVTAAVAANVVVPTGVLLAERVLYLPSVGAALIVGAGWELLYMRAWPRFTAAAWMLTALALVMLAARTMTRIPVWRDGDHFYAALLRDAPASYRALWASASKAFDEQRPRDGEQRYRDAILTWPGDPAVVQELGEHYLAAGLWAPANQYLTIAWRMDSTRADAAIQAAVARLRLGAYDSAAAISGDALRLFPRSTTLLAAAGDAWLALGHPVRALTYRRRMVYAQPAAWQPQIIAAEAAARADRCEEAHARSARAAALAPRGAATLRSLDSLLADLCPAR